MKQTKLDQYALRLANQNHTWTKHERKLYGLATKK